MSSIWKIITGLLVALTTLLSYHLIYIIVKNSKSIAVLKNLAYTDNLTKIKNRLALFLDCDELIAEKSPFTLIYMDLDNFKKVNDIYGHSMGDKYLRNFTEAAIAAVGSKGTIYRMSGDEFVCMYKGSKIKLFLKKFRENLVDFLKMEIPFLGVSIGCARFPRDASTIDELIKKADKKMYQVKKEKNSL
jgi:diguanylate cyclase (GGDEF)-like protein